MNSEELHNLKQRINNRAVELGFQNLAVCEPELGEHSDFLIDWLQHNYHGSMSYMAAHDGLRTSPETLLPGSLRVMTVRMDYVPGDQQALSTLEQSGKAYIARYALGRDYHKLMRKRLATLASDINNWLAHDYQHRAFVDSAPVLERALAQRAGQGWIGKNTMLINARAGSWFFLGELFTNLALPIDPPQQEQHCGSCSACLDVCPTNAFVKPWVLDARRCISYLTIESHDAIPLELRPLIGNRVFGCDDCQLVCPWNKFAQPSREADFQPRHNLDNSDLVDLFNWSEDEFLSNTEGSAIRRIGHIRWLRNLAVGLGNADFDPRIVSALRSRLPHSNSMLQDHIQWALAAQLNRQQ